MKINSFEDAIHCIETQKRGIPVQAIKYLRNQPPSNKLTEIITFSLEHAYDGTYYEEEDDFYMPTPLWYAIVAEKHLSEKLIDPVISLYTTTDGDWSFLNEQGEYLVGKLAEKYPDVMGEKIVATINKLVDEGLKRPYLFLYDAFYYMDVEKYKNWMLGLLKNENLYWRDSLVYHISDLQIKEAIPILKDLLAKETDEFFTRELKEGLRALESGVNEYPDLAKAYCEKRENWEEHYSKIEQWLYEDRQEELKQMPVRVEKIGRNQPCPCGSGKKYKKCCLH